MTNLIVINKKNDAQGTAVELESGRFAVTEAGQTKEVAASTFKRWYKVEEVVEAVETVKEVHLTNNEKAVLNGMRINEFQDAYLDAGCTWTFTAIDYSGLQGKVARGAISSLIKKGLVIVTEEENGYDNSLISFTDAGFKVWEQADGEETTWGGPNLFKVEENLSELLQDAEVVEEANVESSETVETVAGVDIEQGFTKNGTGKCSKVITKVEYMNALLVITEYDGYVCDVVVTREDGKVYKSAKMSIKDALENGLGLQGEEMKVARKHIMAARKAAKQAL